VSEEYAFGVLYVAVFPFAGFPDVYNQKRGVLQPDVKFLGGEGTNVAYGFACLLPLAYVWAEEADLVVEAEASEVRCHRAHVAFPFVYKKDPLVVIQYPAYVGAGYAEPETKQGGYVGTGEG
jgi:hypothetical protein